jgi:hypothetical protein
MFLFFFFFPNTNKLRVSLASTKRLQKKLFFLGQHSKLGGRYHLSKHALAKKTVLGVIIGVNI